MNDELSPTRGVIGMDNATAPGADVSDRVTEVTDDGATAQTDIVDNGSVAFAEPPPLVYVDPDVYVAENADQPVYYVDGSYWRDDDGGWSRADYWDSPWVVVAGDGVPDVIRNRRHEQYRHFRADRGAHVWREPRDHETANVDRVHPGAHQMTSAPDRGHDVGPWPHARAGAPRVRVTPESMPPTERDAPRAAPVPLIPPRRVIPESVTPREQRTEPVEPIRPAASPREEMPRDEGPREHTPAPGPVAPKFAPVPQHRPSAPGPAPAPRARPRDVER